VFDKKWNEIILYYWTIVIFNENQFTDIVNDRTTRSIFMNVYRYESIEDILALLINDKYHNILKWVDENYMLGMVYKKYRILQINIPIIIIEFETYKTNMNNWNLLTSFFLDFGILVVEKSLHWSMNLHCHYCSGNTYNSLNKNTCLKCNMLYIFGKYYPINTTVSVFG